MLQKFAQYPTFIVFISVVVSVAVCLILMPFWKKFVKKSHIGQQVRADGPESHLVKQGTPTMGGVIILVSMAITVVVVGIWEPDVVGLLIAVLAAGILGFIDDSAKVLFHRSLGLNATAKLIFQFLISTTFILYAVNFLQVPPTFHIPMVCSIDLGIFTTVIPIGDGISIPWLYLIIVNIIIVGMCNAVNLTDGLDGLAAGACTIVMIVMAAIAFRNDALGSAIIAAALAGACIGFLWYNSHPADIFMGDTGSLALGMALGCMAVLSKTEVLCLLIGGLFVIEALSVIIQVAHYKRTKKRVFLMSPLHHHFEKKGWSETKVVVRFWIISGAFAALGFSIFFAQSLFQNMGLI